MLPSQIDWGLRGAHLQCRSELVILPRSRLEHYEHAWKSVVSSLVGQTRPEIRHWVLDVCLATQASLVETLGGLSQVWASCVCSEQQPVQAKEHESWLAHSQSGQVRVSSIVELGCWYATVALRLKVCTQIGLSVDDSLI